ncbi:MAG: zinc ABC transporter substrate-binding protein [Clostridiales bacterium]|nr:zinc ABC transporter substrate-binding protein [Clostridiales bacterium]
MKFGLKRFFSGILAVSFIAGTAGVLCSCRRGFGKDAEGKVKVVATIFPMYDFAKRIGGDKVAVKMMIPAGTEPHEWEPSTQDMLMLEEADLFVYNGAGMEPWAEDILGSVQNKDLVALEASKDIALLKTAEVHDMEDHDHEEDHDEDEHEHEHEHHHHHGEYDPHVWLSPKNAEAEMTAIAEALIAIDEENADTYRKNLEEAKKACEELDGAFAEALQPYEGGYIVVAHEAYGYLCRDYGLKQIGIEGVSADQEPDAARMREIIDKVDEYGIKCIFFEELVDPKVAQTIADEAGCRTMALSPLDGLSKEDIDSGRDYFSVMQDNLNALVSSFE